ncbi:MAG TPA: YgiT-type zinc finger protein [Burkholderiales bacterium]|nr:YgiT-type zinc finger protein [Burkholderiales bacterium]HUP09017.1 YgiT-type zinc finger protein [Caldimonas sp.]
MSACVGNHVAAATCTSCGGMDVHSAVVRSAFFEGERLVVVEGIPALVCETCGEQFYDDATVVVLDLLRGEGFPEHRARSELRVPVFSFTDRPAPKEPG